MVLHRVGGEVAVVLIGAHELVADADRVVGVLEEDRRIGLGIRPRAVVALPDQREGLGLFLGFALDELDDVRMVGIQDHHLGGAAGFSAGLDDPGKGVKAAHEAQRPRGLAAARQVFHRAANRRQVGSRPGSPFEEHSLGLGQGEDRVQRVVHRVDEAGRALGIAVAGPGEGDAAGGRVPVPVLPGRIRFQAVAAHVEPDRRVEGHLLGQQHPGQLVVEDGRIPSGGEVAAIHPPVADALDDAAHQLADAGLPLGGAQVSVQVLRGHNVGRGHRPVGRHLDLLLLEDDVALAVSDRGGASLPLDLVVRGDALGGEAADEGQSALRGGSLEGGGRALKVGHVHEILSIGKKPLKNLALSGAERPGGSQGKTLTQTGNGDGKSTANSLLSAASQGVFTLAFIAIH